VKRIDLNVDIGEGYPNDFELIRIATSANICCGEHAGSRDLTLRTIQMCRDMGVRMGAHPGYPDRASMGRAPVRSSDWEAVAQSIEEQVERMLDAGACDYVKPHGSFYNDSVDEGPAAALVETILLKHRIALLGLADTCHEVAAHTAAVPFAREGFADRAYTEDGRLVPRSRPGAVLTLAADVRAQALRLAPNVDSICLHGDTDGCVEFAAMLRGALEQAGFEVGL